MPDEDRGGANGLEASDPPPDPAPTQDFVFRNAWRKSPERRRWHRFAWVTGLTVSGIAVISSTVYFLYETYVVGVCRLPEELCNEDTSREIAYRSTTVLGVGTIVGAGAIAYAILIYRNMMRRELQDRLAEELSSRNLVAADEAVYKMVPEGTGLELAALWRATHERLNLYHSIATKQARDSFYRAQFAMAVGFIIVVTSIPASLLASTAAGSITAGILGAVGATLSGYVSRTFIRSQESAAQHLRAYFLQPLEFSRYLVAERLLDTLSEEFKAQGILAIVHGIAQTPLLEGADGTPVESADPTQAHRKSKARQQRGEPLHPP